MATVQASGLLRLPAECLEIILDEVDLQSIQSLRQVSKALSRDCNGPRFQSFLGSQLCDLSPESLRSLCDLAASTFGQYVRRLKIECVTYEYLRGQIYEHGRGSIEPCNTQSYTGIEQGLTEAFKELGNLDELVLDHVTHHIPAESELRGSPDFDPNEEPEIAAKAIQAKVSTYLKMVMSAIAQSGIAVTSLDLYRRTSRGAVVARDLASLARTWQMSGGGGRLERFAVTISRDLERPARRVQDESTDQPELMEGIAPIPDDPFAALASLLAAMPLLEHLHLKCIHITDDSRDDWAPILQTICGITHLPHLRTITLAGLVMQEDQLYTFLARHHPTLQEVQLRRIRLRAWERWPAMLERIRDSLPKLHKLSVSALRDDSHLLNLDPVWARSVPALDEKINTDWSFPYTAHRRFVHTLVLEGGNLRRDLEFKVLRPGGRTVSSVRAARWHRATTAEFGRFP
jgi:hypothetical protein